MARDWQRLGAALRAARIEAGLSQPALAKRAGIALETLRHIELADRTFTQETKVAAVAREVGWAPGSVDAVLAGGDPTMASATPAGAGDP